MCTYVPTRRLSDYICMSTLILSASPHDICVVIAEASINIFSYTRHPYASNRIKRGVVEAAGALVYFITDEGEPEGEPGGEPEREPEREVVEAGDTLACEKELEVCASSSRMHIWVFSSSLWFCIVGICVIKFMNSSRLLRPSVPNMPQFLPILLAAAHPWNWQLSGDVAGTISQTFK